MRFIKSLVSSDICGTLVSVASDGNESMMMKGMLSVLVSLLDMSGRPAYSHSLIYPWQEIKKSKLRIFS